MASRYVRVAARMWSIDCGRCEAGAERPEDTPRAPSRWASHASVGHAPRILHCFRSGAPFREGRMSIFFEVRWVLFCVWEFEEVVDVGLMLEAKCFVR